LTIEVLTTPSAANHNPFDSTAVMRRDEFLDFCELVIQTSLVLMFGTDPADDDDN
jgi:hypothetical protein